ncbi:TPA: aspartate aminotransferase family protein [Candidatus Poribacteria bacterium]|jgi:adenosylmethionine-8-amino-7-oxononanoate aminotransferase|nr:aspartate aminotransferase family protein [Candidatus Poribacteria bacterium]HIB86633.1 aspartate aminotransferase family protein [Candidatus Poribacteria bacterium]HIC00814.1 aspartate aminotransferase family protein [Candidatus Poribacteria bacterium]HIM10209.1 aspartate aminotransferase family protein [Candidatus Poribacteria bacterium]HIN31799.1 aspartate aminotransferase family protein [Candidatus Poribacteria bacterium]
MNLSERQQKLLKRTFLDYQQTLGFIQNPLIIHRAEGIYYWDVAGKRYFDGISGIFVATLGHRHPRVMTAMQNQMEILSFAPPMHGIADVTLDFVEKLGEITPGNLNYVKSYSGGSESIESAIKFTRQYFKQTGYPGKYKFISRYFGYHGATFGAMSASGTGKRKTGFEPQMGGFLKVFPPTYYRDRFSTWEECNRFCAQSFEDVIINEDPETVAGIIIEPIGNTGGIITPTEEYFQIIRQICDRYNVILIYDEIITGFARTGAMFAAQTFGVTPDIICSGKGLSSGAIPLGAMIAKEDMGHTFYGAVEDEINFAHGHTFAGNPLACAVGIAVIDEIQQEKLDQRAQKLGNYLATKLKKLKRYGVVREVRGKGLLLGVELVKNTETMTPYPELGQALKRTTLQNGLILRIDPSWFAVAPALIATESDIDELGDLIEKSLVDALKQVEA